MRQASSPLRSAARPHLLALAFAAVLAAPGCALFAPAPAPPPAPEPAPESAPATTDPGVYRRADADRVRLLEREIERLRADLHSAEETLLAVESGMRGDQTRAQAVSMLAEARIQVDRAAQRAPWRADAVSEAREKLAEAETQLGSDHIGSAIFFVSRASRIAAAVLSEADLVSKTAGVRYVRSDRVNLREAPNTDSSVLAVLPADLPVFPETREGEWTLVRTVQGQAGWVHGGLLRAR